MICASQSKYCELKSCASLLIKAVFHFNRTVYRNVAYSIVSILLVLPEYSRNNEYATFCYDTVKTALNMGLKIVDAASHRHDVNTYQ